MALHASPSLFRSSHGKPVIRYGLLAIVVVLLSVFLFQAGVKYLVKQWLLDNGADSVVIEEMWLNPFAGKLSLEGVEMRRAGQVVYSGDLVFVNISPYALFKKNARVEKAVLKDIAIDIHLDDEGILHIGSYRLLRNSKKKSDGESPLPPWTFKAEEISLTNVEIRYRRNDLVLSVKVDDGSAVGLDSSFNRGPDNGNGRLALSGSLNDAPFQLEMTRFLLSPRLVLAGELKLSDFALADISPFLPQPSEIAGTITSLAGSFGINADETGPVSYAYDGSLKVAGGSLDIMAYHSSAYLAWDGKIRFADQGQKQTETSLDGTLSAKALKISGVGDDTRPVIEAGAQNISVQGKTALRAGEKMRISSDASLGLEGGSFALEKRSLKFASASWTGELGYGVESHGKEELLVAEGTLKGEEIEYVDADTLELRQNSLESKGKAKVLLAGNLQLTHEGETALGSTSLSAANYSFNSGGVAYRGQFGYQQRTDEGDRATVKGTLVAKNQGFLQKEVVWELERVQMESDFRVDLAGSPRYSGNSTLEARKLRYLQAGAEAATLAEVKVEEIGGEESGSLGIGKMTFESLALNSPPQLPLSLHVDAVRLSDVTSEELKNIAIQSLTVNGVKMPSYADYQLDLSLDSLEMAQIASAGFSDMAIEEINLTTLSMPAAGQRPYDVSVESLAGSSAVSDNLRDWEIARVTVKNPVVLDAGSQTRYAALQDIIAENLQLGTKSGVAVERIAGRQAEFLADPAVEKGEPQAALAAIEISALNWSEEEGTHIAGIVGSGLQSHYVKSQEDAPEKDGGKHPPGKKEETGAAEPIPLRIDKLGLEGDNRIVYRDTTLPEPFKITLGITSLDVENVNLNDTDTRFSYNLEGTVDEFSPLTVTGGAAPLASPRSVEHVLRLRGYPLPNLSPYLVKALGTRLIDGKLDLVSKLDITGDAIKITNDLEIQNVETNTVHESLLQEFNARLPVSLETALSFLEQGDGKIELSLPIEGWVSSFDVSYTDILITGLSNSITRSVQPLLAYTVLGPTGVMAFLGMHLGKKLLDTDLEHISYAPGAVELTEEQKKTLDKVGAKLERAVRKDEKESYYIAPKVAAAEVFERKSISNMDQRERQALYDLGERRARVVKAYLMENFDLGHENLPLFQPGLQYEKNAKGTVGFMK